MLLYYVTSHAFRHGSRASGAFGEVDASTPARLVWMSAGHGEAHGAHGGGHGGIDVDADGDVADFDKDEENKATKKQVEDKKIRDGFEKLSSRSAREKVAKTVAKLDDDYYNSVEELKDTVRQQIEEDLGIPLNSDRLNGTQKKLIKKYQYLISKKVIDILEHDKRKQRVVKEWHYHEATVHRCVGKLNHLFHDPKRQEFLALLGSMGIPLGATMGTGLDHDGLEENIKKEIKGEPPKRDNPNLRQSVRDILAIKASGHIDAASLLDNFEYDDVHVLENSINLIETAYTKWNNPDLDARCDTKDLRDGLATYKRQVARLSYEVEKEAKQKDNAYIGASSWPEIFRAQNNDILLMQSLLDAGNPPITQRRFIRSYLDNTDAALKAMRAKVKGEFDEAAHGHGGGHGGGHDDHGGGDHHDEAHGGGHGHDDHHDGGHDDHGHGDAHGGHDDHGGGHGGHDDHLESDEGIAPLSVPTHEHHGNKFFTAINKYGGKALTLNHHLEWWTFADLAKSWEVIGHAWEHKISSRTEDRGSALAEKLTGWHPKLQHKVHEVSISNERKRAGDEKTAMKNFDYDTLVHEWNEDAPNDAKRAVLEILAERGNLRMSNKHLITTLMHGCPAEFHITDDMWRKAEKSMNYATVTEKFKSYMSYKFQEAGYGQELISQNASGLSKATSSGEEIFKGIESDDTGGEMGILEITRRRAQMEGEGKILGIVKGIVGAGNAFSHNGGKLPVTLKVGGNEVTRELPADVGTIGLQIVDSFLRGDISAEIVSKISHENEGVYSPYGALNDNLLQNDDNGVCAFETWGWITPKDSSGKRSLTALGVGQIINYFNGVNARTKFHGHSNAAEKQPGIVHVGTYSGTYRRQTSRRNTIEEWQGLGDKCTSGVVKNARTDVFDQSTKPRIGTGNMTVQTRQISNLIKAAVEDICDGKAMIDDGEQYYDSDKNEYISKAEYKERQQNGVQVIAVGEKRYEQGVKHLILMLTNLWATQADRNIISDQHGYIVQGVDEYGKIVEKSRQGHNLKRFIETQIKGVADDVDFDRIWRAYERLADTSQVRNSQEMRDAVSSGVPAKFFF